MKSKRITIIIILVFLISRSCNEPETTVTNFVNTDGSVVRKIDMRSSENNFKVSDVQVPFDTTWLIKDTTEINDKGDTTWIRSAEKLFSNTDEINQGYLTDSGANREIDRSTGFVRKFRWFNTEYRFAEMIGRKMLYGYPVRDFLNEEELLYFYSPDIFNVEKLTGSDSSKYKALDQSVMRKTEKWIMKSIISEWINEFGKLTRNMDDNEVMLKTLKDREDEFVSLVEENSEKFDSLWNNGILLKEFIGAENSIRFKAEADSAVEIVTGNFWVTFKDYKVRIVMPGKLTATNGFIDTGKVLLWPVKSDYFLTQTYEMWAESRTPNIWAWIVSGVFVLFVLTGLIVRAIRKG